jgi:CheY-like chemotaxis protein
MPCSDAAAGPTRPYILVVEDDVLIRMALAELLRGRGAGVIEAVDGEEALAVLAAGTKLDLMISDIRMPGRVDGVQLAWRVRDSGAAIPIILTSAEAAPDELTKLGIFIQKPYDLDSLLRVVEQIVDLPAPDLPAPDLPAPDLPAPDLPA